MNHVSVGGVVENVMLQVKSGSNYGKIKICVKGRDGRTDMIEVVAKSADLSAISEGDFAVVQGLLSGKENDRGYINMGIYATGFEVFPVGGASNTDNQYNGGNAKRRPSARQVEEDLPF